MLKYGCADTHSHKRVSASVRRPTLYEAFIRLQEILGTLLTIRCRNKQTCNIFGGQDSIPARE